MIIGFMFGIGSIIFSFYLQTKDQDYKYLPILHLTIGFTFTGSSIVFIIEIEHIMGAIIFFGGIISVIIFSLILRKPLKKERVDRINNRLKDIDPDEKINLSDIYKQQVTYKLMLKKGPKYAAKILTLFTGLSFSLVLTLFQYAGINIKIGFLVISFLISFSIFSLLFYFRSKNLLNSTYEKYHEKYSDDDLFSDSPDFK